MRSHTNTVPHETTASIRTILISLITAGVIWLIYTVSQNKSDLQLINYKIEQTNKSLSAISKDIETISQKVK